MDDFKQSCAEQAKQQAVVDYVYMPNNMILGGGQRNMLSRRDKTIKENLEARISWHREEVQKLLALLEKASSDKKLVEYTPEELTILCQS